MNNELKVTWQSSIEKLSSFICDESDENDDDGRVVCFDFKAVLNLCFAVSTCCLTKNRVNPNITPQLEQNGQPLSKII